MAERVPRPHEGPRERRARPREEPILAFRDVRLSFDRPILKGVSFDLAQGTTKIILAGSGSGKTTIPGAEVAGMTEEEMRDIRLKVGMVFQEGALFDPLTVGENVGYRLAEDGLAEDEIEDRVREMLGFVEIGR